MGELWRYTTGIRRVNRVTVYERVPGGAIQIEWWDHKGRHRQSLRTMSGHPVTDQKLAMAIADHISEQQRRHENVKARDFFFRRDRDETA